MSFKILELTFFSQNLTIHSAGLIPMIQAMQKMLNTCFTPIMV